ncbi:MAG: hypothetical protein ABI432_19055 [Flavobacteriales bacterium]
MPAKEQPFNRSKPSYENGAPTKAGRASSSGDTATMAPIPSSYFFLLLGVSEIALAVFKRAGNSTTNKNGGSFFAP